MRTESMLRFLVLAFALSVVSSRAQRVPDATDPEMIRKRTIDDAARFRATQRMRGVVSLSDGTPPKQPVELSASCPTFDRLMAITDAKGKFSFSFDPNRQSDIDLTGQGCFLQASLEGFRSERVSLADLIKERGTNLGRIVLKPRPADPIKPDAAIKKSGAFAIEQENGPAVAAHSSEPLPTRSVLHERNAPLLANSSAYTCLESVMPVIIDLQGRRSLSQTIRADIAVSEGKEIYGPADGERFFSNAQNELLGRSFSTWGLFSSIARALLAANQFAIEPAGVIAIGRQTFFRYDFHPSPGTAGWAISYGKETGTAAEHGWFFVDGKHQILRRVFVTASEIPRNLKLTSLNALIEYQPETIAGHRVLLPSVARVNVAEQSGTKRTSFVSFDHCRAFTADSAISFEEPDAGAQEHKMSYSARLPADVEILVSLSSDVSIVTAEGSDLIAATVFKNVVHNGRKLIAAGALVEGHVSPNQALNSLVIQLDRVATENGWAPFYARLVKLSSEKQARIKALDHGEAELEHVESDPIAELPKPDVPGVASLSFTTSDAVLSAGTLMLWKTEPL